MICQIGYNARVERGGTNTTERAGVAEPVTRLVSDRLLSGGLALAGGAGVLWSLAWLAWSLVTGTYASAAFFFVPLLFFTVPALVSLSSPLWGGAFLIVEGSGLLAVYAAGAVVPAALAAYLLLLGGPVFAGGVLFVLAGFRHGSARERGDAGDRGGRAS